jgi:F-type H+-transporting ATPase subunit gamma
MPNLKEVKNRINSVTSTQQITKAMKMVAAAKLRKAQDMILRFRPYAEKLAALKDHIVSTFTDEDSIESPFIDFREVTRILMVVIASDRGLCGAFNSATFKKAVNLIETDYKIVNSIGELTVMPIGKKAVDFFRRRPYPRNEDFSHIWEDFSFEKVGELADFLMDSYKNIKYDQVVLVYNEFKNAATQILKEEQYLPIMSGFSMNGEGFETEYIFEPTKEELLTELIPSSLKIELYKVFLESSASEQGARMVAMEQATENAGELLRQLRLTFNRTRQASITREILEIVAGAEALSSGK